MTRAPEEARAALNLLAKAALRAMAMMGDPVRSGKHHDGAAGGDQTAFLGVERSASGRRWRLRGIADDGTAAAIATQLAVPEILARLLSQRGVELEGRRASTSIC